MLLAFQYENNVVYTQHRQHFRVKAKGNVDEKEDTFLIIIKKSYLANAAIFPSV